MTPFVAVSRHTKHNTKKKREVIFLPTGFSVTKEELFTVTYAARLPTIIRLVANAAYPLTFRVM
jgi:hypothetical protein